VRVRVQKHAHILFESSCGENTHERLRGRDRGRTPINSTRPGVCESPRSPRNGLTALQQVRDVERELVVEWSSFAGCFRVGLECPVNYTRSSFHIYPAFFVRRYSAALEAWEEVRRLEPDNRSASEGIALCTSKTGGSGGSDASDGSDDLDALSSGGGLGGGGSGFPGGFGGAGGMPNIAELLGNPGAMASVMNDPRFAQMAQQVMSNPALMQSVMGMMGGLGGMGGSGPQ
jgi:hypothetical protein